MTAQVRRFDTGATRDLDEETELAWAAGFFDGEGSTCCTYNNGRPHNRIQLSIGQKNDGADVAETLIRFQRAVGGVGNIYQKTRVGKEINQHQFLVSKMDDVRQCISMLWPYLSTQKRNQFTRAAALLKAATGKEVFG